MSEALVVPVVPAVPVAAATQDAPKAPQESGRFNLFWLAVPAALVLAAGGWMAWRHFAPDPAMAGLFSTNGRIEANQVDIATKMAGRVLAIVPHEGDMVEVGSTVAVLDGAEIDARLRQSQAEARLSRFAVASALAVIAARDSELKLADQQLQRTTALARNGYAPKDTLDQRQQVVTGAASALAAAKAQSDQAVAAVAAADAQVDQLKTLMVDTTVLSPVRGRVQYRLIELGAVIPAGGKIVTLLDLADVSMTIFLPATDAAKLVIGDEARVVLDAFPDLVFPARVSFVAAEAQFTPKTVETATERETLMFRVKLQATPDILTKLEDRVKTGLRGVGYVRLERGALWPDRLAVRLPQ